MKIKFLLASVLVIALVSQSSIMNAQQKNEKLKNDGGTSLNVMTDMRAGSGETLINFTEDEHHYKIRLSGSKVIEMFVDDKKVAEEDYAKYDSLVKKILLQIEKDRKQAEEDRKQAEKDREQADKDREQANADRTQAEKDRERADQDRKQAGKDREQAEKNRQQADKDRERAEQDREQAGKDREQAEKDRQQAEIDRKRAEEDRKLLNEMIDEVIKEKLVENKEALKSLVLDNNEFIVNGIKQPDNLHSKFKTKYLKSSHRRINYKNSGEFRGLSVD
jgi:chromosome segregation ATPase